MADRLRDARNLAALQARYVGTGSADTGKYEFVANMQRDTLSHIVGHPPMLQYAAIGLGKTREQARIQLLERMVRPAGPPPKEEGVGSGELKEKLERQLESEENERRKHAAAKERRAREAAKWGKK